MARPTHSVYIKRKGESFSRKVGAGWMNDQGWLSLRLDLGVCLTDREDVYINIYPNKPEETEVIAPDPDFEEPPDYLDEPPPPEEP